MKRISVEIKETSLKQRKLNGMDDSVDTAQGDSMNASLLKRRLQLKPEAKRSLLEQAHHATNSEDESTKLFGKVVIINKSFLNVSKLHRVYSFHMDVEPERTEFGFSAYGSVPNCSARLMRDQACRLILFLNPKYMEAHVDLVRKQTSPFLDLLAFAADKIGMELNVDPKVAVPLVGLYWFRLAKLECEVSAIDQLFPVKSFQSLHVKGIRTMDQLRNVLRHNISDLTLTFHSDFSNYNNDPIHEVGRIRKCKISFDDVEIDVSHQHAVQTVVTACPNLEKLEVEGNYFEDVADDFGAEDCVEFLVRNYNLYNGIVRILTQSGIPSEFDVHFDISGEGFTFPLEWQNEFATHGELASLQQETIVEPDQVVTKLSADQDSNNVKAAFCAEFRYSYIILDDAAAVNQAG